jgi:predicted deacylase
MKRLKMLEGTPTPTKQIVRKGWWSVYVKHGGVCHSVPIGARVKKGQQVAEVHDLFGERLETLESPVDGRVVFRRTPIAISTNDRVLGIVTDQDLPPPKPRSYL